MKSHTIIKKEHHVLNQHGLGKKPRVNGMYSVDKQQVLLYSTGNYIQYHVINYNGKEYEKECVCVYI